MLKIYRTVQEAVKGNHHSLKGLFCYIKESNVKIQTFRDCMRITDLTNALKRGKTCTQTTITYKNSDELAYDLQDKYLNTTNRSFQDLLNELELLEIEDLQNVGFKISIIELKSTNVFSPFVEVKPTRLPANGKWTKSHIVKAILSGQIYQGVVDSIYTDDYAYDNTVNCHEGEILDLMEMAKELTEDGHGWTVRFKENNNGNISLKVDCHTFNLNTLYFNVDSRQDNLHYTTVSNDFTSDLNTVRTTINTNSKLVSIFTYKQQKQENKQQLFSHLSSSNSLDQFKNILERYLKDTKQDYIITNNIESTKIESKLKQLSRNDIYKMFECVDISGYFPTKEDLQKRNICKS